MVDRSLPSSSRTLRRLADLVLLRDGFVNRAQRRAAMKTRPRRERLVYGFGGRR